MGNKKFPPFLRIRLPTVGQFYPNGGQFLKKGGDIFVAHQLFLCVLDVKFKVDYDFSIKHDLILWSDQLMGIHSLHQKGGNRSIKKGENFLFPTNVFMCIRCRIQCRLWFCHQTWPNFMIRSTYGCSKLENYYFAKWQSYLIRALILAYFLHFSATLSIL